MSKRTGLVVTSDPHSGSTLGLLPPHGTTLDDGNVVLPNLVQEWLWQKWTECWAEAQRLTNECDELIVVVNGDLTDGYHHGTYQVITPNPVVQKRICMEVMSPMRDLKPDRLFIVRGTPAHGGEQASHEEEIAQALGAVKDSVTGASSRWKLDVRINGTHVQAFHHGKLGMYTWTEQAAMQRLAWQIRTAYDRAGAEAPDLVFLAHRHGWGDSGIFSCPTRVVMSPGWQGATQYVHKVVPTAGIVPVGMWVAILEEGTKPVVIPIEKKPLVPKVEELQ